MTNYLFQLRLETLEGDVASGYMAAFSTLPVNGNRRAYNLIAEQMSLNLNNVPSMSPSDLRFNLMKALTQISGFLPLFWLSAAVCGQQVPSQLAKAKLSAARTVFVLNQGAEGEFSFDIPGGINVCYNEFYASLKQAGIFELVDGPDHADLIMAIHCTEKMEDVVDDSRGNHPHYSVTRHSPFLNLAVLNPGNSAPLYTIRTLAGRASNIPKGEVAMANSINGLTQNLMAIIGKTSPLPAPATLINETGPVPPQVLRAKKVYLRSSDAGSDLMASLTASLNVWGRYTIVDAAEKADLVFEVQEADPLRVNVYTPSEDFQLWTVFDPNFRGYGLRRKKLIPAEVANMMKAFKTLNGEP